MTVVAAAVLVLRFIESIMLVGIDEVMMVLWLLSRRVHSLLRTLLRQLERFTRCIQFNVRMMMRGSRIVRQRRGIRLVIDRRQQTSTTQKECSQRKEQQTRECDDPDADGRHHLEAGGQKCENTSVC